MPHVLTFDLGTTYFKAALFGPDTRPIALARHPTPAPGNSPGSSSGSTSGGKPGTRRVEMDPLAMRHTLLTLAAELQRAQPAAYAAVRAICFASQANSFLLLDEADQPLTQIISWTDRRAAEGLEDWLDAANALPERYEHTGIPTIGPNLAAAKLKWIQQHQPRVWQSAHRLCLISDELTRWLCGAHVTEAGVAALTGLLDIHTCQWWSPALDHAGIDRSLLPEVVRAGTDAGSLTTQAAQALQLPEDVRVVVGCLDQYAGAIAAGNLAPGKVSETTGTVLAVVAAADRFDPSLQTRGVYQGPAAVPGLYYRMAFSDVAAALLDAYQREYAPDLTFQQLDQFAEAALVRGVKAVLNVAASEASGRPVFAVEPTDLGEGALAIMQAVAQRLREHLDTVCGASRPDRVTCLGGAARSQLWRRLKAQATGLMMQRLDTDEPTCLGAAICARDALARSPE